MRSHHRIVSVGLLAILISLPTAGTLCGVFCDPTEVAAPHHHHDGVAPEATHVAQAATPIASVSGHDCRAHDALLQDLAVAGERLDRTVAFTSLAVPLSSVTPGSVFRSASVRSQAGPPGGTPPPTALPVVLRV